MSRSHSLLDILLYIGVIVLKTETYIRRHNQLILDIKNGIIEERIKMNKIVDIAHDYGVSRYQLKNVFEKCGKSWNLTPKYLKAFTMDLNIKRGRKVPKDISFPFIRLRVNKIKELRAQNLSWHKICKKINVTNTAMFRFRRAYMPETFISKSRCR